MVLGVFAGIAFHSSIVEIKPVGTAFIRLIQMVVVPLVLASLLVGTASLGDPKNLGRIGLKTLIYYLASTAAAITVGLVLANLFRPGSGLDPSIQARLLENYGGAAGQKIAGMQQNVNPVQTFLNIIPTNPAKALSEGEILQVIFFAIFTGVALIFIPAEKADPVIRFFDGLFDAMIQIVTMVIKIAPYGVFALIAAVVGDFGVEILLSLLKYTLVVIGGLMIMFFIYPLVVRLFTGMNPGFFLKGIRPAQLIAFSTSSSGATLPVTLEVCEQNLGVSNKVASFVLPLGATVNMDGTALYQGVAALFIAQVYGIPVTLSGQLTIILTATLASIGTAAVPGVGLFMLIIVLKQVGIPLEGIALILSVDRLLDMFRTMINVTSDCTASVIVAHMEKQLSPPEKEPVL
ncbi:MAG: dicarboxylate/amino acid:cation symporter [Calditrichaeota bacterium]|nr:MAG: dicarboxylate/amino acid:cation symporter [Calditrichota bacterium]